MKKQVLFFVAIVFISTCASAETALLSERELRTLSAFYSDREISVTATRTPKPLTRAAENITVITADDIKAMNAHTVAEVLNRVPGMFVNFTQDFGTTALLYTQSAEDRHTLVLVDGARWNFLGSNTAETNTIPIRIIERIEIVKGPASSAWGSSLGGVVNIITKKAGTTASPTGSVRISGGEHASLDAGAEMAGMANSLGYYLFAGTQQSDGLRENRHYRNNHFFSKFAFLLGEDTRAGISVGYSAPNNDQGDLTIYDISSWTDQKTLFSNLFLTADLGPDTRFEVAGHYIRRELEVNTSLLGLTPMGRAGDLYLNSQFDESNYGLSMKIVRETERHTLVAGIDFDRGNLEQTLRSGSLLQMYGAPAVNHTKPSEESWAVYANDTIVWGRWAITPGVRFDHNSVSGGFFSPSLGITYQLCENTILRAGIARGFHYPPLSASEGGGLFVDPNPSLDAEEVWSYQAGIESTIGSALWFKTTVFRHDQDKAMRNIPGGGGPPAYNDLLVNSDKLKRQGIEIEIKTQPIQNFSVGLSGTYVHLSPALDVGATERWQAGVLLQYDDMETLRAQLYGGFVDWDVYSVYQPAKDMVWDFNLQKTVYRNRDHSLDLFFSLHNILDGSQYVQEIYKNPSRWVEGGLQWRY